MPSHSSLSYNGQLSFLLRVLSKHEEFTRRAFNLTPSENILSPLAKLPFLLDAHTRYFLDDLRLFGKWCFPSGREFGKIEQELLIPLLTEMAEASYVDVRAISGINCMTIALAAMTESGNKLFCIPTDKGGHPSTTVIGHSFGLKIFPIPFENTYDIDLEKLRKMLVIEHPKLIYIDQGTLLFPIDPRPIRDLVDEVSPETIIHYDSSHINGLILGKAIFNPLERGAHCYGGSTHKTLPGPHKGFLATNNQNLALRIRQKSDHFVSHHHMASIISLTITLLEMKLCKGDEYAKTILSNSKILADTLAKNGFIVAAADKGYTQCHQIWAYTSSNETTNELAQLLLDAGLVINRFNQLPGINQPAYRLSLAEATRMGALNEDAHEVGIIMSDALNNSDNDADIKRRVKKLREKLMSPKYCFQIKDINEKDTAGKLYELCNTLASYSL